MSEKRIADVDIHTVKESLDSFLIWLSRNGYQSYDPHDLWSTPYGKFAKRAYYKNNVYGAALVAPVFLLDFFLPKSRSLFVRKKRFPIADAHFIMGFLNLCVFTGNNEYLKKAVSLSGELLKQSVPGYSGYCWGYPFDWQTNRGLWKKDTPLITVTPYCFEAFAGLYHITGDRKYLDIVHSISRFVLKDLQKTVISDISSACSYSPVDRSMIINANAYRSFLLMEAFNLFGEPDYKKEAVRNINFVMDNQRSDGAWSYAVNNPRDVFVDNMHTCMVLKNLYKANKYLREDHVARAVQKGYTFYRQNLIGADLMPKPFAETGRLNLIKTESYDLAEGISLGVLLRDDIKGALELSRHLAGQMISRFQVKEGYFVTRSNAVGPRNTVPYLRWAQAQTFFALTNSLNTFKD